MIAILCSTFREGLPFASTLRSAIAARPELVLVCEAAIGDNPPAGDPTPLELCEELADDAAVSGIAVVLETPRKPFVDDAAKRTSMLQRARTLANDLHKPRDEPLWILWLDGDELLVWGEYFRDMTYAAGHVAGGGGFPLRIVELDGSVAMTHGKVVRSDVVTKYLHSSYQVELVNGTVVALPNVKVCSAGGIPFMDEESTRALMSGGQAQDELMAIHRPPLAGEPHLLHRSVLRAPERIADVQRQSEAESEWFSEILGPDGQTLKRVKR